MISQIEREELAKLILCIEDEGVIDQIKNLLKGQADHWDTLPDLVKADIEESIKQLEEGLGISHTKMIRDNQKWL